jgi:hypothetical protein
MANTDHNSGARDLLFEECEALRRGPLDPNRRRPVPRPAYSSPGHVPQSPRVFVDSFQPAPIVMRVVKPLTSEELEARSRLPYGQRIRDLRRALRWTQRDVAGSLGMSVRTVIRHERSQSLRMHLRLLWKLRELELAYAIDLAVWLQREPRTR